MNDAPREPADAQAAQDAASEAFAAFVRDPLVLFAWGRALAAAAPAAPVPAGVARARRELGRLVSAPGEALLAGLDAALLAPDVGEELRALQQLGVLALVLPEVDALVGFHRSCAVHHKDLWDHTLRVIARLPLDADLRWAALMHDAGKLATRFVDPDDKVAFIRHEAVGAWLMLGVARRLAMPEARAARIAFVIEHHGRVNAYEQDWTDRAVARLVRDAGERLSDLLAFSSADFTTKRTDKSERIQDNLRHLRARLAPPAQAAPAFPRGLGAKVAEALGIPTGPALGAAMRWLAAAVASGRVASGGPIALYVDLVRADYRPDAEAEADQKG